MNVLETLQLGIVGFMSDFTLIPLLIIGVFFGMVFGAIPGLTAALAVTLILPFTFAMTAGQGLTVLIAIYVGGISGGLISASLLNIPGTPASLVTCFDGAPMARNGRPEDALFLGVFASAIGGLISGVALIIIAPQLARVALMFGPWEYFALGIMGLMVIISICSKNMIKGFIAAMIGLLLSTVGLDPISSVPRFTFNFWQLNAGMDILATLMGIFALAEIMIQLKDIGKKFILTKSGKMSFWPRKDLVKGKSKTFTISSIIGVIIGILPGIGQSTASMIAYNTARQMSDTPEKFGTGIEEGVIASEAANNAVCGGAMIPMMTLGIPGDTVTAILLGGLIVHGLQPGPLLFQRNASIVGVIFIAYILAVVVMYFMELGLMQMFIKLLRVPLNILFPIILLMCVVGTFTVHNRLFDTWILIIVGVLGFLLIRNDFPLPPIVLGFILGPIIESNFRTGVVSARGTVWPFFSSPLAVGITLFGVLMLLWPSFITLYKKLQNRKE